MYWSHFLRFQVVHKLRCLVARPTRYRPSGPLGLNSYEAIISAASFFFGAGGSSSALFFYVILRGLHGGTIHVDSSLLRDAAPGVRRSTPTRAVIGAALSRLFSTHDDDLGPFPAGAADAGGADHWSDPQQQDASDQVPKPRVAVHTTPQVPIGLPATHGDRAGLREDQQRVLRAFEDLRPVPGPTDRREKYLDKTHMRSSRQGASALSPAHSLPLIPQDRREQIP